MAMFMDAGLKYATFWGQLGDNVPVAPPFGNFTSDTNDNNTYKWVGRIGSGALVYMGGQYSGAPEATGSGMKMGNLYPVAHAFELLNVSGFTTTGEHMLQTWTDMASAPWLQAYGATHGSGHYALILINRDRDNAHTVPVQIAGLASGSSVQQWTYGRAQYDFTYLGDWSHGVVKTTSGAWSGTANIVLPAFSAVVVVI